MGYLKTFITTFVICLAWQQNFAQVSTIKSDQPRGIYSIKGDYYFDHQNLIKAIEYYGKSVKEKPKDTESMLRMAEAYYKTYDIESADFWYKKALKLNPEIEAAYDLNGLESLHLKPVEDEKADSGKPERISIYTSNGNEITLVGESDGIFSLSFDMGYNYNLFIDRVNNNEETSVDETGNNSLGGSDETISTIKLEDGETYNFHIEKFTKVEDRNEIKIQKAIASPGEMLTFRFLPDYTLTSMQDTRQNTTKLLYQNNEVKINSGDTIVFGYLIKGDPQAPEPEQEMITADTLTDVNQSVLRAEKTSDTTNLSENALVRHIEKDTSEAQNADDLQYRLLITASTHLLTEEELKEIYDGDKEVKYYKDGDYYVYYIAEEPTFFAAEKIQEASGMEEAVIVAYKGDVKQELKLPEIKMQELSLNNDMSSGEQGLPYPVLLTTSSSKLTEEELKSVYAGERAVDYFEEDGAYTYFVAEAPNFTSAEQEGGENGLYAAFKADDDQEQNADDLQYRLLITASTHLLTEEELKEIYDGDKEVKYYKDGDYYVYYIAEEPTFFAAEKIQEASGMEEAVIVAYKGDVKQELKLPEIKMQELSLNNDMSSGEQGLPYPVLLTTSSSKLTEEELKSVYAGERAVDYFEEDGAYTYFVAEAPNFTSAEQEGGENGLYAAFKADDDQEQNADDLQYRLLITASTHLLTEEELKEIYDGDKEVKYYKDGDYYVYYIAEEPTFFAAEKIQEASGMEEAVIVAYKGDVKQELKLPEIKMQELSLNNDMSSGEQGLPYPVLLTTSSSKLTEEELKSVYAGERAVDYFEEDGAYTYFVAEAPNFTSAEQEGGENGLYAAFKADDDQEQNADDLQYRLLITASTHLLTEEELKEIYDGDKEVKYYKDGDYYVYYIAEEPTFFAAEKIQEASGMEEAVIVAYKGDVKQELKLPEIKMQELSLNSNISSGEQTDLPYPVLLTTSSSKLTEEELKSVYAGERAVDYFEEDGAYTYFVAEAPNFTSAEQEGGENGLYAAFKANNDQEQNADDLQYRLLITASTHLLTEEELKEIYDGDKEVKYYKDGDYYVYYIAEEPTFFAAEKIQEASGVEEAVIVAYKDGVRQELNLPEIKKRELSLNTSNSSGEQTDLAIPVLITTSTSKLTEEELKTIYSGDQQVDYFEEDGNYNYFITQEPILSSAEQTGDEKGLYAALIATNKGDETQEEKSLDTTVSDNDLVQNAEDAEDLQYRVQIGAFRSKLNEDQLKSIYSGDLKPICFEEDGYFKYYIVEDPNYFFAKKILNECSVDQAFIAAYKGGAKHKFNIQEILLDKELNKTNIPGDDLVGNMDEMAGLQYRVQIRASKSKLSKKELKKIYRGNLAPKYFKEDGYYKYYVTQEANYFAAKQILNEIGVKNSFVVAYKDGKRYNLKDAMAEQYIKRTQKHMTEVNDSIVTIVTVNFKLDEFTLLPEEKSRLQEFVDSQLKDQNHHYVIVNGHTDIRGSDTYNFGLSEERALFVKEMIIGEGINPERVKSFYFGETQLAKFCGEHENCDESVHQANRRVEVFLLSQKSSENHAQNSSQSSK